MIEFDNQTTLPIDTDSLEVIAQSLTTQNVELILTDDATMQHLNREHRGKDQTTDVLSFPLDTPFIQESSFHLPLGSIVIADSFLKENGEKFGHSIQDEFSLLFIHGMLHLLGFDHETDHGEMRQREKELIEQFDLPKSLIIRTQEE